MTKQEIFEAELPYEGGKRLVRIFVPEHETGEKLPVVYMTDGQNLFEEERCSYGCWHTREAVAGERGLSGKAAAIVGIHNEDPIGRANELTPSRIGAFHFHPSMPEEIRKNIAPKAEVFDAFLINTVMPYVEENFPVKKGRDSTAFCGSSSGGLFSFYTALTHPDVFCAAGVFSPVFLMYSPEDLRSFIYSSVRGEMPYLYFYMGGGDPMERGLGKGLDLVYDILLECYPPESLNEVILTEEKHHESAWEKIFTDFLHTFLAGKADMF